MKRLGEIGKGNLNAVNILVKLIQIYQDEVLRWYVVDCLKNILVDAQMVRVVISLKDFLSEQTYENDCLRYRDCYKVIWHCAQTIPYPAFYQAWHHLGNDKVGRMKDEERISSFVHSLNKT